MKVWVVTYYDWDTEGNTSSPIVAGVFSSEDKIPEHLRAANHPYEHYATYEVEVDHVSKW